MTHRKEIRNKVVEILKDKTGVKDRVYSNRVIPIGSYQLPAISIYTRSEILRIINDSPRQYERTLQLVIDIAASATNDLDDVIDDLAISVEKVMENNEALDDLVSDITLIETEIGLDSNADKLIGIASLVYEVKYCGEEEFLEVKSKLEDLNTILKQQSQQNK